ncbi:MAG: alanine--tRNA ligase [Synergistes jonesii]|uniref:alanine--tRNA ligase n=1 Tax=Synergistes jonesii TaxID=2754 RepID=UPI002A752429|nr:alanine--tRNA ligase [Synergistes jonesii]MDY2985436.1 alanine--tRNA ligase [Synergistes jonesii]
MERRSGKELRELFLKFFEEKGCKRYHSFSLVPDDPTLLFTIAGMVPFKPYFLGLKKPEVTRATTAQKCVRTNDIENVGHTARHHTFFEMLGNFSFGDYFKEEIIPWAWEFLTERVGLDPNRLYATVYLDDDEAFDIWHEKVGLPKERIFRLGEDDNFWAAGPVGPCGPCSEIIYDQGEEFSCGKPSCNVGCDCDRYLEIWNLVFMQYNRDKEGKLTPLPKKNIDTGMGLERLASVVQGVPNDFETDLFRPIMEKACELVNVKYGEDPKKDMAVKIISDHIRASAFMIADGVLPTNDGTGYVLRRLIRRSVRFGRLLGIERPFLTELLPVVRQSIGDEYHELVEQASAIEQVLSTEEERFSRTLSQGSELMYSEIEKLESAGKKELPGDVAFVLYDTFGFPLELTEEMCEERGISVDEEGFEGAMEAQRERARAASRQTLSVMSKSVYTELADRLAPSPFCGYEKTSCEASVEAIIVDGASVESVAAGAEAELVLSDTPFYGEKGGQVGDKGTITAGGATFEVEDTLYPAPDLIIHRGKVTSGAVKLGDAMKACVDEKRRAEIRRHHTATHLLHEALTRVLGKHVRQAGSIVTPTFLRFDFNHFAPVTIDELREVERIVYGQVLKNAPVVTTVMALEDAKNSGARALFEEKYGDRVRVVSVQDFSTELCGGTHVKNTGEIGLVKIIREEGIGSGIRRITAVAGSSSLPLFQSYGAAVAMAVTMFGGDVESLQSKLEAMLDEKKVLERKNRELQVRAAMSDIENSVRPCASEGGVELIIEKFDNVTPDLLRQIGDRIRQKYPHAVTLLAGVGEEKRVMLTAMASPETVKLGANAGQLIKAVAAEMGGKGGGSPALAQGGAQSSDKLDKAFAAAPAIFKELMAKKK